MLLSVAEMRMVARAVVSVASMIAMAAVVGCAGALEPTVAAVGPREPQHQASESASGGLVQAGTIFSASMDQAVDTYFTAPGSTFTATVVDPLYASRGQLVVPYGAKVHGTVASVGPRETPHVRLRLYSIETVRGNVPLVAAIRQSQYYRWLGPDPLELAASATEPHQVRSDSSSSAYANLYGYGLSQPREVHIPDGALLELALITAL